MLALGGIVAALAAAVGGATSFGASLLSAPFLLLLGFPLPVVVTANLTLTMLTRVSVVYRFRRDLAPATVAQLVLGSVPGILVGVWLAATVNVTAIRVATGILIMIAAILLACAARGAPPRRLPGALLAAGMLGGVLGATTSLNGVPAALLLARDRVAPRRFLADLAGYFLLSNAIALALLAARGVLARDGLVPAALLWAPGALLGNYVGATWGARLPAVAFRRLVLAVIFVAGAVTAVTA